MFIKLVAMLEKYVGVSTLSALRARYKVYIRSRARDNATPVRIFHSLYNL
jgi:hypothetical protein